MSPKYFYHPQTKLREGYAFTAVCDSVQKGGSASVHSGIPHTPGPGTRPEQNPPEKAMHAGRYSQQAGGMHPTGMQYF